MGTIAPATPAAQGQAAAVDFFLPQLDAWRRARTEPHLAPARIREIVLSLLRRGNFRFYSEAFVAELATVYGQWLLQIAFLSKAAFGPEWRPALFGVIEERRAALPKGSEAAKDLAALRSWLLTTTSKTDDNLDYGDRPKYLQSALEESRERVETQPWGDGGFTLAGQRRGETTPLDRDESVWLLRMAGSASVAVRGAVKSIFGKRLERAFLGACFELLGMRRGEHFELGVKRGRGERDAVVWKEPGGGGEVYVEMGLIGKGNSEIVKAKAEGVSPGGIVIYDDLPPRTRVHEFAAQEGRRVRLVGIRHRKSAEAFSSPLHDLYEGLGERVGYAAQLSPPPEPERFKEKLEQLDLRLFQLDIDAETIAGSVAANGD